MIEIVPGGLCGSLVLPASKSHTLRAILFATLAEGTSHIHNILLSPDTDAMIAACKTLGAKIIQEGTSLSITGGIDRTTTTAAHIDAGNSGIVLRFITAVGALTRRECIITGDKSCQTRRPCLPLLEGLEQMGATISYPPMRVQGPLHPANVVVDGADSQPVSALMIAASMLEGITEIHVKNLGERPWLNLTLDWLRRVGVQYVEKEQNCYSISGCGRISPFTYRVPCDLSSLAFPLTAALLTKSNLVIEHVDLDDVQGDKVLLSILAEMGAQFVYKNGAIHIFGPQKLSGCDIDVNDCIDALPILAVIGCFASGQTRLYNGAIARKKESDRIASMQLELTKMGASIQELPDGLVVRSSSLQGANLESHEDHRVAMSLAVAALGAQGTSRLAGSDCIKKTYKNFFLEIQRLKDKLC